MQPVHLLRRLRHVLRLHAVGLPWLERQPQYPRTWPRVPSSLRANRSQVDHSNRIFRINQSEISLDFIPEPIGTPLTHSRTQNDWLRSHGGYAGGCNIYWGAPDRLGYTHFMGFETPTYSEVCSGVSRGHGVLINVRHGSHWVLVTGCAGNGVFHVNDPGFSQSTYHTSDVSRYAVYH